MKVYAVKVGKDGPNIYKDWLSCESAVKGFAGAKFKSFPTEEEAQEYLDQKEDILKTWPEGHHICCDASSSIKENYWEYQLVWTDTKEVIYKSPTYKDGTNNTGEVMGLCQAILHRSENGLFNCNIYTDSQVALSAISKGSYNMKSKLISEETKKKIISSLDLIKDLDKTNIIHWNNHIVGENPADFGRK